MSRPAEALPQLAIAVQAIAAPDAERALLRAIERAHAGERISVVPLAALARERSIPSAP